MLRRFLFFLIGLTYPYHMCLDNPSKKKKQKTNQMNHSFGLVKSNGIEFFKSLVWLDWEFNCSLLYWLRELYHWRENSTIGFTSWYKLHIHSWYFFCLSGWWWCIQESWIREAVTVDCQWCFHPNLLYTKLRDGYPVGKIAQKAVRRSVFWHCILSAELKKTHSFRHFFWRFCPLDRQ